MHAVILEDVLAAIPVQRSLVIAVDASLGSAKRVGSVGVCQGALAPGSALGKSLPRIGDVSISGIVAEFSPVPFLELQNTPLGMVFEMAELTAKALRLAVHELSRSAERQAAVSNIL